MKKATFAILLTILITFACIFASCNENDSILGPDVQDTSTDQSDSVGDYSSIIKELEDQILELKKDQYISDSKRTEEISRLEALILELKQSGSKPDTDKRPDTDTSEDTKDTDTSEDTESNTHSPTEGKFIYTVNDGKATIIDYTGNDSVLTIPSSIDGHEVIGIADDAFDSKTLYNVTIPEGVSKIGWFAFKNCTSLRSVTIPQSVESIGYGAFPTNGNGFSIICHADSFAAKYAQSYGIAFSTI